MKIYQLVLAICLAANFSNDNNQKPDFKNLNMTHQKKDTQMNDQSYTSTFTVDKTAKQAFDAIKDFKLWWSEDIEGETDKLNETFFYHYKDIHLCKIKLIEMVENKKLVYKVLDNQFNFTKDKTEWIGTELIFEISSEGKETMVKFTHEGLVPTYECYNVCNDAWTGFIQKSLKSLITTGKGQPNPKDGTNDINSEI